MLHAARSVELCSYGVNCSNSSVGFRQPTRSKYRSHVLTASWYDITTSDRSCFHELCANHYNGARRVCVRVPDWVGPSDWIWYAPRILYSIGYGARQSIGIYANGPSAEHIGFTADDEGHIGNLSCTGLHICLLMISFHSRTSTRCLISPNFWDKEKFPQLSMSIGS